MRAQARQQGADQGDADDAEEEEVGRVPGFAQETDGQVGPGFQEAGQGGQGGAGAVVLSCPRRW
jgi:hypothetical protein